MVLTGAGMSTESGIPDYRRYGHDMYVNISWNVLAVIAASLNLNQNFDFMAVLMEHTVLVSNHLLMRCVCTPTPYYSTVNDNSCSCLIGLICLGECIFLFITGSYFERDISQDKLFELSSIVFCVLIMTFES